MQNRKNSVAHQLAFIFVGILGLTVGASRMAATDWARGTRIEAGERLA